jgi:hypothetical protein
VGDIDFNQGTMSVTRSIVYGVVGSCKTESSQKPVPLHQALARALVAWRNCSTYTKPDDWVFASKCYRGRRPYWGQAILSKYIRPAAQRVGIQKRFGWHTFRHSYSTLLRSVGTEFKVMQELLRHSSLRRRTGCGAPYAEPGDSMERDLLGCGHLHYSHRPCVSGRAPELGFCKATQCVINPRSTPKASPPRRTSKAGPTCCCRRS